MAAFKEPEEPLRRECENCSSVETLSICSRCRSAWFCSLKCQRSYWPFHKAWCRANDFADAIEAKEPKFAAWMRKHGKIGVIKDDEVDRLERKTATMEDMYGKANPKPAPPSYDADDVRAMRAAEERALLEARSGVTERLWASIGVPELLGLELEQYKWRQNQSYVEVFMQLPAGVAPRRVVVALSPTALRVAVGDEPLFGGALFAAVKAEESLWLISDGVLEIRLLKRSRRGFYANGACNADTYWWSLFAGKVGRERIAGEFPPPAYYKSEWENIGTPDAQKLRGGGRKRAPALTAG